jgi:hypothetical protein
MLVSSRARLLSCPGVHLILVPMTADELLSLIRALPDARRLPADPPLMATAMVAGIEIASIGPAPDRALRRI